MSQPPPAPDAQDSAATSWRGVFREYTAEVRSADLARLFQEDAVEAYRSLSRGGADREGAEGSRSPGEQLRHFLRGIAGSLSPPRRYLLALALLLGFVSSCDLRFHDRGFPPVTGNLEVVPLLALGSVVLLLVLELMERQRVRNELEVARDLQRELLPRQVAPVEGWEFAHSYRTAAAIGGDYYDVRPLPDGRLVLVAGDASGHGLAAGLLMVIAHTTLRLAQDRDPEPTSVLALVNEALVPVGGRRAFLTLFYGVLDPATGRLVYASAGHPFPLLRRADGNLEELGVGCLPLGIRKDLAVPVAEARLDPGDLLLLYSDGLPEAWSPDSGEVFGFDRMRGLLAPGGPAQEVHDRVVQAWTSFQEGRPATDDSTLLVVERHAGSAADGLGSFYAPTFAEPAAPPLPPLPTP